MNNPRDPRDLPIETCHILGDMLIRGKVKLTAAAEVLSDYGVSVKREPMGFTFWKGDRRFHGVFNHSPITPDQSATFLV